MSLVVCPSCGRHAFQHETSCPHCGQKGKPTLLALTAALGLLAACSSQDTAVGVYGPAPIDPNARQQTSAQVSSQTASAPPIDPPAQVPSTDPSAIPLPSATTSAPPTLTPPTSTAPPPRVKVYGPPPRDPGQRN